ncbi:hypothetical protein CURTO8I2_250143 [Curtobacterium sp. 8I-2]|nr:hypothetical protein CURTO8I2_250143 [Curtobacterium sp. 8I-2]
MGPGTTAARTTDTARADQGAPQHAGARGTQHPPPQPHRRPAAVGVDRRGGRRRRRGRDDARGRRPLERWPAGRGRHPERASRVRAEVRGRGVPRRTRAPADRGEPGRHPRAPGPGRGRRPDRRADRGHRRPADRDLADEHLALRDPVDHPVRGRHREGTWRHPGVRPVQHPRPRLRQLLEGRHRGRRLPAVGPVRRPCDGRLARRRARRTRLDRADPELRTAARRTSAPAAEGRRRTDRSRAHRVPGRRQREPRADRDHGGLAAAGRHRRGAGLLHERVELLPGRPGARVRRRARRRGRWRPALRHRRLPQRAGVAGHLVQPRGRGPRPGAARHRREHPARRAALGQDAGAQRRHLQRWPRRRPVVGVVRARPRRAPQARLTATTRQPAAQGCRCPVVA